jgi:ABC-type multidrug transport system fused ATPase/permease subunit
VEQDRDSRASHNPEVSHLLVTQDQTPVPTISLTMVYLEPPPQLLQLLHESLPSTNNGGTIIDNDETAEVLAYTATIASSIIGYDQADWISALQPYLSTIIPSVNNNDDDAETDQVTQTISSFLSKTQALNSHDEVSSDEEDAFGGEQITDIRFSLAYGGKILLHQTKLRLRRGHVYALVGQNGVGKTSE